VLRGELLSSNASCVFFLARPCTGRILRERRTCRLEELQGYEGIGTEEKEEAIQVGLEENERRRTPEKEEALGNPEKRGEVALGGRECERG
jgi:hypothetical protein